MTLDDPVYPERNVVWRAGERPEALHDLTVWVRGRSFHRYGDRTENVEGFDRDVLPVLNFRGELVSGAMHWTCTYRRWGHRDETGSASSYSHPADAAYACLAMIEQHEREVYEESLVVGIA